MPCPPFVGNQVPGRTKFIVSNLRFRCNITSVFLLKYEPRLHIVLHQPEIPQNTGAIGRTCVAIRAKLWLVRPLGFRLDSRHMRRAGLDYWQHLEWEAVDHWPIKALAKQTCWFFSKKSSFVYTDAQFHMGDVLVFGSETQGLPGALLDSDRSLRIPMHMDARSLNLSNAVAISAYEALRQISYRRDENSVFDSHSDSS